MKETLTEGERATLIERAIALEREAHRLREEKAVDEAFQKFDEAESLYRECGEHLKAVVCFASAATCWNIHTGWQPLKNAATRTERAAEEAMKAKHFYYARSLFLEAALLYEKEGNAASYSACFWRSKLAGGKHSWQLFIHGREEGMLGSLSGTIGWKERGLTFGRWIVNTLSRWAWGYGERPFRTLGAAALTIFFCALIYQFSGEIRAEGVQRAIHFGEALYFSVVTFATAGYRDYLPLGWARLIATFEGLSRNRPDASFSRRPHPPLSPYESLSQAEGHTISLAE